MATDDERRRVAAALRAYDGKGADADTIGEVMAIIIGAGDFEGWSWREVFARLADLIEPSYDRDALLALADEMERRAPYALHGGWRDSLRDYARRIREACGVVA